MKKAIRMGSLFLFIAVLTYVTMTINLKAFNILAIIISTKGRNAKTSWGLTGIVLSIEIMTML
ncbi:hypothetical protein Q765_02890 [Flavobacterium rivuli WB 3.3-2 = DSM 21788]|uniref:Uncharacterized protein n=1 Tax=Flavobacterium rivuli WB 3.3-2 = DSM 21788 TaxID=1121895 RepID=A0A0A2M8Q5_9FLAO|nr:hypothetical protein Q765_02890 [Flavobacterium rivuli WB 3.3-2 = DSM 21788]